MGDKYEPIRANDLYVRTSGKLRVTEDSQLDRVEKKVDRILEHLFAKESDHFYERPVSEGNIRITFPK